MSPISRLKSVSHLRSLAHALRWKIRAKRVCRLVHDLHPRAIRHEFLRFGPDSDGGYLVPGELEGIVACFSPGVNYTSGFEKECARRGMEVFLADGSVDKPADDDPRFHFSKAFIGGVMREGFLTMEQWVDSSGLDDDSELMLQMDIEGHEYEVFQHISKTLLSRFRIIVVEFHALDHLAVGSQKNFLEKWRAMSRLLETHTCIHLHPNNACGLYQRGPLEIPKVMEFTFLRSDLMGADGYCSRFPHPLDADNRSSHPTLVLPKCWYRAGEN